MAIRIEDLEIEYPDSDGEPMADNTLQFRWIVTIKEGLEYTFRNDPNVFVAGDLLWYPVRGDHHNRLAPDAMVVFGRPKGERGSYRQWMEGGLAPQVVFEVLSPGNTPAEMLRKRQWYARYGVEEYYEYDPDNGTLRGWQMTLTGLMEIEQMEDWVSPRLGVTFGLEGNNLVLLDSNGKRFRSYLEVSAECDIERARAAFLAEERDTERARAERMRLEYEQERDRVGQLAEEREAILFERNQLAEERARLLAQQEQERVRVEQLLARLREAGLSDE